MRTDEFSDYRDFFMADYGIEISATYEYSLEKSRAIAAQELADDLPQSLSTPDHFLLCIEETDAGGIGYLWYKLIDRGTTLFIMDFVLFEPFRGLGHGKAALAAGEHQIAQRGVTQIRLQVAFHNKRALALYDKVGFTITGYNMVKNIAN